MNRKQRLAARRMEPPLPERTVVDAMLVVLGLAAAVVFAAGGVALLVARPIDGRAVIVSFTAAGLGLAIALDRIKNRRRRG